MEERIVVLTDREVGRPAQRFPRMRISSSELMLSSVDPNRLDERTDDFYDRG